MFKHLTRSQKLKLRTVGHIIFFWAIVGAIFAVHNHLFLLSTMQTGFENYDLTVNLLVTILIIPLAGFLGGGTIVYFFKEIVRKFPLWIALIIDTLIIVLVIIAVSIPATLIYNSIYFNRPPWDMFILVHALDFMFGYGIVYTLFFWSLVSASTMIVLQVNEKYGQGVFWKLLKGRYYRPKVEMRIFMFLDIRGSTTIAEKLGHVRWFDLLSQFFNDITEPIIDTKGEIYQYVGDEIIIHWNIENGLEEVNCVNCFFKIKAKMETQTDKYFNEYGIIPQFKAAINCGDVTIGEIGTIKKDIVFTGDVLNTTSRIQDQCNQIRVELLLSEEVVDRIGNQNQFVFNPVGVIDLRGKEVPVSLYSVLTKDQSNQLKEKDYLKPSKVDEIA
ncbi:MAG TPA: adenylate/guanylate cyclase domain-containing protein [Cyclobacteriaceae bacterium]|nr:adenylate/guanylate cyclase domain-containing protein [Cyclobacteriaceae bacterium]